MSERLSFRIIAEARFEPDLDYGACCAKAVLAARKQSSYTDLQANWFGVLQHGTRMVGTISDGWHSFTIRWHLPRAGARCRAPGACSLRLGERPLEIAERMATGCA
jgi:hypothetical protein